MCSEIRHISCSDLLISMSSGSNTTPDSPVEEEADNKEEEAFELQETAPSETAEKPTHDPESEKLRKGKQGIIVGDDEQEEDRATASKIAAVSEDDEGFKTPTSPDHRIPAITQCPPAPIKPRPVTLKRKASSPPPGARRRLQFGDSPSEVESIFRPLSDQKDNVEEQQECKRSKHTDDED